MKYHPISFNTEMVRAILYGRKTQTRRVIPDKILSRFESVNPDDYGKGMPSYETEDGQLILLSDLCPYQIGDRLWARETWAINPCIGGFVYRATDPDWETEMEGWRWKPSIHMPRKASRITLEIVNVRVERIQDISKEDAIAEGVESRIGFARMTWYRDYLTKVPDGNFLGFDNPVKSFASLWDSVYGTWDVNPWVWVVEFGVDKSKMAIAVKEESHE